MCWKNCISVFSSPNLDTASSPPDNVDARIFPHVLKSRRGRTRFNVDYRAVLNGFEVVLMKFIPQI